MLYTFILNYHNFGYTRQIKGGQLMDAFREWATSTECLGTTKLPESLGTALENEKLVKLKGCENVWGCYFTLGGSPAYLSIVLSAPERAVQEEPARVGYKFG